MSLFGGIELVGRPDLENIRKLDLLPIPSIRKCQRLGFAVNREHFWDLQSRFTSEMRDLERDISSYIPPDALHLFCERAAAVDDETEDLQEAEAARWTSSKDDNGYFRPSNPLINASSAEQIGRLLFEVLGVGSTKQLKRTKGGDRISTGKAQLKDLEFEHPVVRLVLDYRERDKLRGTYAVGIPNRAVFHPRSICCPVCEYAHASDTWRVHTEIPTTRAETGRLACVAKWTPVTTRDRGRIEIKDIRVGDMVWTHRRRWRKVTALWRKGFERMYSVTFTNGNVLTCTGSHRLLVSDHEHIETMDQDGREHREGSASLPIRGVPDAGINCEDFEHDVSHSALGSEPSHPKSREESFGSDPLFSFEEGREQSLVRDQRRPASTLDRDSGRWTWVSDLFEGWRASVRSSDSDGGSSRVEETTENLRRPPHRRQQEEQRSRQPSSRNRDWAQENSLPTDEGQSVCCIEKIEIAGCLEIFDISVDEDESYEACGVFSHNSRNPNLMNIPIRSELGRLIREGFIASPGMLLVSVDFSQIELRMMAHLADCASMIEIYINGGDLHVTTAMQCFGITDPDKLDKVSHRIPSKTANFLCIAEGQRVLTDHGLIPIESVTCRDRVWDGEEFVNHDGVICKGVAEVIEWDGVTATRDHEVWIENGEKIPLEQAVGRGARLAVGGIEETPVRCVFDNINRHSPCGEEGIFGGVRVLRGLQTDERGVGRQYREWEDDPLQMQPSHQTLRPSRTNAVGSLHCDQTTLQESETSKLSTLRRPRHPMLLQILPSVHSVCAETSAASDLPESRHRPHPQRRPLHSREYRIADAPSKSTQQVLEPLHRLQGEEDRGGGFARGVESRLPRLSVVGSGDRAVGGARRAVAGDTQAESPRPVRFAPVYDIVNAGPRHRFTVEGKLVSNCQYGGQGKALYAQLMLAFLTLMGEKDKNGKPKLAGIPEWFSLEWCENFITMWFAPRPEVYTYLKQQSYRAKRYDKVWDLFGGCRLTPEVRSCHSYIRLAGERQGGNMADQGTCSGLMKLAMAEMDVETAGYREMGYWVQPIVPIHDQLITEVSEEIAEDVQEIKMWVFDHVATDKQTHENLLRVPIKSDGEIMSVWKKAE